MTPELSRLSNGSSSGFLAGPRIATDDRDPGWLIGWEGMKMAEQMGNDILLKLLDGHVRLVERLDRMDERLGRMEDRLNRTNDTMTLLASVIQQLTQTVKGRLDDHETRISALESR
jgi:hypothetical protein